MYHVLCTLKVLTNIAVGSTLPLLTAVATTGKAPYNSVLTHGFVVDGEGRKMSKSVGNTVAPSDIIDVYGADVMRLWVSSADYQADVRLSKDIVKQLSEVYRKIRNTFRFLLGNLDDFNQILTKWLTQICPNSINGHCCA